MDFGLIIGVLVGIAVLWVVLLIIFWLLRPKDVPLREIVRVIPDVIRLLRSIVTDRSAPMDVRLVIGGLFVWIVSPIDLIPEFLPVIGPLDDVIVAAVALRYVRRRLGIGNLKSRWAGSEEGFALLERVIGHGRPAQG